MRRHRSGAGVPPGPVPLPVPGSVFVTGPVAGPSQGPGNRRRRAAASEAAEGTGAGALRIALWVVVVLGLLALVGPKIAALAAHTAGCLGAAVGGGPC